MCGLIPIVWIVLVPVLFLANAYHRGRTGRNLLFDAKEDNNMALVFWPLGIAGKVFILIVNCTHEHWMKLMKHLENKGRNDNE